MDEAGKMVSEDGTEVTVEGAVEDQEVEKDEDGQEVIKVYIFKADSGEDDMGKNKYENQTIQTKTYTHARSFRNVSQTKKSRCV